MLHKKNVNNCLQILDDEGVVTPTRKLSEIKNRPRSGGSVAKKAPCIARSHSASSIGTHTTPTKHVLLTAARRKPSLDDLDTVTNDIRLPPITTATEAASSATAKAKSRRRSHRKDKKSCEAEMVAEEDKAAAADDGGDCSSDDEPIRAPTELLAEFIDCIMQKDYVNAQKLCKMILIYEPNNAEALNFQPLIEEKLAFELQSSADDDEDETESEDESEEESSGDETSSGETDDERGGR